VVGPGGVAADGLTVVGADGPVAAGLDPSLLSPPNDGGLAVVEALLVSDGRLGVAAAVALVLAAVPVSAPAD